MYLKKLSQTWIDWLKTRHCTLQHCGAAVVAVAQLPYCARVARNPLTMVSGIRWPPWVFIIGDGGTSSCLFNQRYLYPSCTNWGTFENFSSHAVLGAEKNVNLRVTSLRFWALNGFWFWWNFGHIYTSLWCYCGQIFFKIDQCLHLKNLGLSQKIDAWRVIVLIGSTGALCWWLQLG